MFCCTLLCVHSSIAIILMGKRELVALLNLSSWCLVMVERLLLAVPRGCLQFVIVVFLDHTRLLFLTPLSLKNRLFRFLNIIFKKNSKITSGAQWLSGRVLDSRPRGRGFEPHRPHCVVVLEQDTFILA